MSMQDTEPWVTVPAAAAVFSALDQPIPIPSRVRGGWLLTDKAYAALDQSTDHNPDGD